MIKTKNTMVHIRILILIMLEQIIKIIVKGHYDARIPIIENILYFMPTSNTNYSWFNSMFQFGWSKAFHIVIVIVILIFSYYTFKYLEYKKMKNSEINILKTFLFSGVICSLIDKIFWNGSLDYIMLKGFFVFDLKDCYITTFEVLAVIFFIKYRKSISKISDRELMKDYFGFIKKELSTKK